MFWKVFGDTVFIWKVSMFLGTFKKNYANHYETQYLIDDDDNNGMGGYNIVYWTELTYV